MIPSAYPWGKGTPTWYRDDGANDSDKSFTVPAGKIWKILSIRAWLTASADVGDRRLFMHITDGTDVVYAGSRSAVVAASETCSGAWIPGQAYGTVTGAFPYDTGSVGTVAVYGPLPGEIYLPAGHVIRVYDTGAIAVGADDLIVVLHYIEYDA